MLKLIIVDDERIIRETIHNIIPWNSLGITVIGLCKDGIEAFDMIMDKNPDIVMTDIKMPGLSGLELINKVAAAKPMITFVILSGYSDFEFAKQAMRFGVRYYLVKPCNEHQIIEIMKQAVKDCLEKHTIAKLSAAQREMTHFLSTTIIHNIISEGLSCESVIDFNLLLVPYQKYINLSVDTYELCFLYYVEDSSAKACTEAVTTCLESLFPSLFPVFIYAHNTLFFLFHSDNIDYELIDNYLQHLTLKTQTIALEYKRESHIHISELFQNLILQLKRFDTIYLISGSQMTSLCNYHYLLHHLDNILTRLKSSSTVLYEKGQIELIDMLHSITNRDFFNLLITRFLMNCPNNTTNTNSISILEFLAQVRSMTDTKQICELLISRINMFFPRYNSTNKNYKDFINKIIDYVNEHLYDPKLSLKSIAENQLFMNVDYVSKQFLKQTGCKFSSYLNTVRVNKAKELLITLDEDAVSRTLEQVGYSFNSQFFIMTFKKATGFTPAAYRKHMRPDS